LSEVNCGERLVTSNAVSDIARWMNYFRLKQSSLLELSAVLFNLFLGKISRFGE